MRWAADFRDRAVQWVQTFFFSSVKATMLSLFIPVIVLSILIASSFSYTVSSRQINDNAYANMMDTTLQTQNYLNDKLGHLFEQFVHFTNALNSIGNLEKQATSRTLTFSGRDYVNINNLMEQIYSANYKMLDSILVYLNNGKFLMTKNDHAFIPRRLNFDYQAWQSPPTGGNTKYRWLNLHRNDIFNHPGRVVSIYKLLGDERSPYQGIVLFNIRESFFSEILENPTISKNGYMAVLSEDGVMSFKAVGDKYRLDDGILQELRTSSSAEGALSVRNAAGVNFRAIYSTIGMNDWKVVTLVPENEIFSKSREIRIATLYMVLILIGIAGVLSYLVAKSITRPIAKLTRRVQRVREGNLDTPYRLETKTEIGILNDGINDLMTWIKELLLQVKAEQEQKRNSEMKALMAQINPHFLYNTLYSIKQLCDMNESASASNMVMALSQFFRISISGGQEVISVQEEVEHVKHYLIIQKMRYSDQLEYEIEVDNSAYPCKTIKLLLQPLVENALYHGVKQKREPGMIRITGRRSGPDLLFEIRDNGPGMSADKLRTVRSQLAGADAGRSSSYGLRNVNERIRLHYGEPYGLEIDSEVGVGTVARIKIPAGDMQEVAACASS